MDDVVEAVPEFLLNLSGFKLYAEREGLFLESWETENGRERGVKAVESFSKDGGKEYRLYFGRLFGTLPRAP